MILSKITLRYTKCVIFKGCFVKYKILKWFLTKIIYNFSLNRLFIMVIAFYKMAVVLNTNAILRT